MFQNPARKMFIKDLHKCSKASDDVWDFDLRLEKIPNITKKVSSSYVWLQGYVDQVAGKENEVLIVNDKTGKVKIAHCNKVPGGSSWLRKGMYCSVVGTLAKVSALPEVGAIKITDLSTNEVFSSLWQLEVEELNLLDLEYAMPRMTE